MAAPCTPFSYRTLALPDPHTGCLTHTTGHTWGCRVGVPPHPMVVILQAWIPPPAQVPVGGCGRAGCLPLCQFAFVSTTYTYSVGVLD